MISRATLNVALKLLSVCNLDGGGNVATLRCNIALEYDEDSADLDHDVTGT
jgi:hypothetical protein